MCVDVPTQEQTSGIEWGPAALRCAGLAALARLRVAANNPRHGALLAATRSREERAAQRSAAGPALRCAGLAALARLRVAANLSLGSSVSLERLDAVKAAPWCVCSSTHRRRDLLT